MLIALNYILKQYHNLFKMNKDLKSYLICKLCDETYEDPIILPCYKTICSKHVFIETTGDSFKCNLCKSDHPITTNGFTENEEIANLLNLSKDFIHLDLSENNKKAEELCNEFESIINKSELLAKDPLCYMFEYFNKIKIDLDLSREKYVKIIEDQYFKMLKEIEEIEKDLKLNLNAIEISEGLNESNKLLKEKLDEFYSSSTKTSIINDNKWTDLRYKIEKNILIAEYQLNKFESKLLMNKSYKFKPNNTLTEINIGDLCVMDNKFINEDKSKHSIRFKVDNLNTLQPNQIRVSRDLHFACDIFWVFSAKIVPADEFGEFDFFMKINSDIRNQIKNIEAKFLFKIVKNDGSISNELTYDPRNLKLQEALKHNYYIPLKILTNPKLAIINREKNCAEFELDIEIVNK